jgi:hypothetical protein
MVVAVVKRPIMLQILAINAFYAWTQTIAQQLSPFYAWTQLIAQQPTFQVASPAT